VLGLKAHPVLIAESEEQLAEARVRLARVGIEELDGFLDGGVSAWQAGGFPLATLTQISPAELNKQLSRQSLQVLDVRREPEWEAGHIDGAAWWPLDHFKVSTPEIDHDAAIAVHCKSGYRSAIACSLLLRAGFKSVSNVSGGFDAWQQAKLPFVSEKPVGA
jgi:hydroxyacylglutathione hydrolase